MIDLQWGGKMRRIVVMALGLWMGIAPAASQTIPKQLQEGGPEAAIKQRQNNWTIGVAGGNMDGTYLRFADEVGKCSTMATSCACFPPYPVAPLATCRT